MEKLCNVNWNNLTLTDDVYEVTSTFTETAQRFFPMVTVNRKKKDVDKPYITLHIKQLLRIKNKFCRKSITNSP